MGIRDKPIAPCSPWQNGFAERLIGSIRRECVDRDVSGGKGTEEIMAWIDNYCGQHPSDNLYRASAALVDEFRQKLGR